MYSSLLPPTAAEMRTERPRHVCHPAMWSGDRLPARDHQCIRAPCPQPPPRCVDTAPVNPCSFTSCPVGSECRPKQVQCIRPPCNLQAECVPSTSKCGKNEVWDQCGGCENTCFNQNQICPAICNSQGKCKCSPGFFRFQGSCISRCPQVTFL